MNTFIKQFKSFVLIVLLVLLSKETSASHYAAADIHVDYIGTGPTDYTYKITLNLYKACEWGNASLPTTTTLNWSSSCFPGGSTTMTTPVIDTLDQLCDTFKSQNSCRVATSTFFPAFVRHTFVRTVTLPGPCIDWVFSWCECCRNAGIRNLTGPGGVGLYVDAMINNSKKANVNTPRYSIDPIPYFCQNVTAFFPNAPYDPDLDSMVSLNQQPRDCPATVIGYAAPHSLINPIASDITVPYTVDANTGTSVFKPTLTGKFVLAFKTIDYDRTTGELMGYTTRDVQVSVLGCSAPPPTNDSTVNDPVGCYQDTVTKTLFVCPGQPMRFSVGSTSNSLINAIYARWDVSKLPGATYTSTGDGTARAVGTLVWTPSKSDVGDHVLSLRFVDSTCSLGQPLITETYYVIKITVLPFVDGGKDGLYCIPGGAAWKMQTASNPGMRYKWTSLFGSPTFPPPFMDDDTLASPSVKPGVLTRYVVVGDVYRGPYRCTTRDTVDVNIGTPLISIDAGPDQVVCANKPISLKANISPLGSLDFLRWSPGVTLDDSTKLNAIATAFISTDYIIFAQDKNGCGYTDTTKIIVDGFQPLIAPFASRDTVCPEGFTQLFSNVSQQPCGIAQSSCSGGVPTDKIVGTGTISSLSPTPFFHTAASAGQRMQILYRRDELLDAGIKAGFINSMSFNLPVKNTTDSFYKFTIKMACTPEASLSGSTISSYPGTVEVYPARRIFTNSGWNDFVFPNAYYWDGSSNLVVEICWSKMSGTYGGTPEPVYSSNTGFTSVKYIPSYSLPAPGMGDGCSLATGTTLLASTRPNTRFNVCITPSLFTYSWTPTSYLSQADSANTNVDGIKDNTTYNVRVTAASNPNCFTDGQVPITVDRSNSVTALPLSPVIHCRPGYFYDLDATGNGLRPLRNLACGTSDVLTCGVLDNKVIANPSTGSIIAEPFNHPFNGNFSTAHTQFIIPKEALRNGNITSGTIRSIAFNAVSASSMDFANLKISMKCTDTKQFTATPPVSFETGAIPVYTAPGPTVINAGYLTNFILDQAYNWDTSKNLLIDLCYAQATIGTGPTINMYTTPGFNLMVRSHQTSGDVCSNPTIELGPTTFELLPNFQIGFCSAGDTDFTYLWTPGNYFEDSLMKQPLVYVGEDTKVFVSTRGRNGCLVKDSVSIVVPKNGRFITRDTIICANETIQLRSFNGLKTKWFEMNPVTGFKYDTAKSLSCDSCERVIAKPKQNTTYYAAVTDINGCIDTFRTSITVKPLPTINITNRDTVIKYGKSVSLNVFGGTQYHWTPMAGISNPNNVNPTASPLVTTVYRAVGIGMNGCRGEDSVKITIDYKSPISAPSAFTPNGDGNNDRFRLMGVTFQTLTEFRVFNRWGQEVFSTQNINDGWDGTFNGKPMDMGAYNYIIRVGYPDGATETLKGDVTLIR